MKRSIFLFATSLLLFSASTSFGQLQVDDKDINADKNVQYIQFLYYVDKGSFRPVYLIDYGLIDTQQGPPKKQKLMINKTEIKDNMSPIYILNQLYKAGWEYMGDEMYVHVPMGEGWYSFTLKRKK